MLLYVLRVELSVTLKVYIVYFIYVLFEIIKCEYPENCYSNKMYYYYH